MARTPLLSGFDLHLPELPDDARLLLPPIALPGVEDFEEATALAMEEPVEGEGLPRILGLESRVCIVVDDLSFPVPPMLRDCRREMLAAVLRLLGECGVKRDRTTVLLANGLNRQWRPAELTELFGVQLTGSVSVGCHDAEDFSRVARVADDAQGPIEANRALVDADLVVYVNVVSHPLMAGLYGLVAGTAGYRTARFLNAPSLFENEGGPLVAQSPFHRAHERVGAVLAAKTRIFQVSAVLNNELWAPALAALFRTEAGLTKPIQVWNALPAAVRHRAARVMKANYRPIAVHAGPPAAVATRSLEIFYRQHEVITHGEADVLLFGLPDVGPYSVHTAQNPVLAANLALGYVANLLTGRPLLRQGGVLVFSNPLTPSFDRKAHLPHEEFYERVLRLERDPAAIHERFEPYFAGRPEFVANYQKRFAYHGTHPLHAWYQCTPVRRRASKVIVAHGDPRACARLGFMPAANVEDALGKARELLEQPRPSVAVLELPPPFFVTVR